MRKPRQPDRYTADLASCHPLTREEEDALARQAVAGDARAAERLVTSNLRFVMRIASGYRRYGLGMDDLIQEGNLGLVRAVGMFDPTRGIRLISYAVWWIRAYIQNYILKSWSLVKLGTTQAQRKLFFSLARTRRELEKLGDVGEDDRVDAIARKLQVKAREVREMEARMRGDVSVDAPASGWSDDSAPLSCVDTLEAPSANPHEHLVQKEETGRAVRRIRAAIARLPDRQRRIIQERVMAEKPRTLLEMGAELGCSRELVRQIEMKVCDALRTELADLDAA